MNNTAQRKRTPPKSPNKRKKRAIFMVIGAAILLPLAVFLSRLGYDQWVDYRYPQTYHEFVTHYADQNNLPPDFVFAVIKCESGFDPEAVSPIGARGLMQLTEETFEWVQGKMNDPTEKNTVYDDLFDPQTNIKYGTYLLRLNMDTFEGNLVNVLCAYHAGRTRTLQWLADPLYSPDGKTVTAIPYNDTSTYVDRVLEAKAVYETLNV